MAESKQGPQHLVGSAAADRDVSLIEDLAGLAAKLCGTPVALLALLDGNRQWVRTAAGVRECHGRSAFHMLAGPGVTVITDAAADERFRSDPLVAGPLGIRCGAVITLLTAGGVALGTLGVLDVVSRRFTDSELSGLTVLARQLTEQLQLRQQIEVLSDEVQTRRDAETALRRRQQVLDGVLRHTDVLVYAKDLTGRYILANDALEGVLDLDAGLLGGFDEELFPPELARSYRASDQVILARPERQVFDEQFIHPDGSVHLYRGTKFPLLDEDQQVYAIAGVSTDVTSLMAARSAHEERWRALVEHSPVAVAVLDAQGSFAYLNPALAVLLGAEHGAEMQGRPILQFVSAADRADVEAVLQAVLSGSQPLRSRRWKLLPRSGSRLIVEVNGAAVSYGGVPALQLELRDVTAAVAAEEALRDSEHRFHALFNGSPVAMALSDSRGLWVEANAAFGILLGVDPAEMIGFSADRFTHPDDRFLVAESERGQRDSPDGVYRVEMRLVRPDGSLRWAWLTITPTPGPQGQTWTLAIAQDVTARKAAEDALRESEADLAAIAAVARCVQEGDDPRPVVVRSILELSGASHVSLLEPSGPDTLEVTAVQGLDALGATVSLSDPSMTASVFQSGEATFVADVRTCPLMNPALLAKDATASALWQPVIVDGKVQAVLAVTWRHPISDPGDRAVRSVRVIADEAGVSLNAKRLRLELERSAQTDPLTGLLNRRAWDAEITAITARLRAHGGSLAVALVDLDHFKVFNDSHGHAAGDVLLQEFAETARGCLRAGDVFARWGGEEFIIALPDTTTAAAADVLDRVRACLPTGSTCSVGQTNWDLAEPMSACIARADSALYDAKQAGRDRVATR